MNLALIGLMLAAAVSQAQTPAAPATVRVLVVRAAAPLGGARVAAGDTAVETGADGRAILRVASGPGAGREGAGRPTCGAIWRGLQ
jgi:hypothetical protein